MRRTTATRRTLDRTAARAVEAEVNRIAASAPEAYEVDDDDSEEILAILEHRYRDDIDSGWYDVVSNHGWAGVYDQTTGDEWEDDRGESWDRSWFNEDPPVVDLSTYRFGHEPEWEDKEGQRLDELAELEARYAGEIAAGNAALAARG